MITNAHFVSFSPCGGTEKVMQALGRNVTLPKRYHNITLPGSRVDGLDFAENDLVFLGFPVYGGRMPRFFPSLIASLHGKNTPVAMVAVYGNREFEGAFLDMSGAIMENGFRPVAAVAAIAEHSISPHIAANRPDTDDTEKLADYGMRTLQKAQSDAGPIEAPGAYPTWKVSTGASMFPRTDAEACNECGACVQVCPNGAIPAGSPRVTETEKCMICAACVKYCPQKARVLGDPATRKELASHLDNAIARKEPTLFV